jgi:ribonuclease HI
LTVWEGSTLYGCFENWDRKEAIYITLPSMLCWFVWLERNKKIFEGSNPSPLSVVYKLRENLASRPFTLKKAIPRIVQIPSFTTPIVSWFDGATQLSDHRCGAGGLIKISANSVYKWTFNCGIGTNTRAELLGAWATHILVVRLNIEVIQVIGDSKIIIDWLKDRGKLQIASLMGWMDRINKLKKSFREIHYTHVYRELNKEANFLSKKALTKTEGKIEYNLWVDGNEGPPLFFNLF